MSRPDLVAILRGLRFLDGLSEADVKQIASVAKLQEYPAGTRLFREGERLSNIFLVAEGSVSLEICVAGQGCRRLHTVGPGELLGWSPVLDQTPMTATARAVTPARLVTIDAGQVLALCYHDPKFGFAFMRQTAQALAARLGAARLQLVEACANELPVVDDTDGGAD
jgi:CRP-like cAMP-binding protein